MVDAGLYITYVLGIVALGAAVLMPIINAAKTPGAIKQSLIGIGALVGLFGISYLLTGSSVTAEQAAKGVTESSAKLIGAGLTMLYIVFILGILGMVYSEISKAIK